MLAAACPATVGVWSHARADTPGSYAALGPPHHRGVGHGRLPAVCAGASEERAVSATRDLNQIGGQQGTERAADANETADPQVPIGQTPEERERRQREEISRFLAALL